MPEPDIRRRIDELEQTILQTLGRIERQIIAMTDVHSFFDGALRAYRDKHLPSLMAPQRLLASILKDADLRFPHRKLLESLLDQYDPADALFKELHFSRLVKLARVSKRRAKQYLTHLIDKGYVLVRADGYRVLYRVNEAIANIVVTHRSR